MGVQPPFIYDPIKTEGPRSPYREFDPKAVTRASQQPKPRRPKQEGPLVSFNQHPDSFLILPYGKTNAKPMNPSVKKWIKWARILQLFLRCLELVGAGGLLAMMIMIRGVDDATGWIMRIVPGLAIAHTLYAIYHLARKAAERPPASTASYMLFASFLDATIIPFYAFSALAAHTHEGVWRVILNNQELVITFSQVVFLTAITAGGLHLVSLAISLYLAVTFRKITNLPPDMNPLEDHLTSRHKRNKSSVTTTSTMSISEKRISTPLESKRSSGAAYEDLSRPPTIPFFHTRTQSTDSFSTYKSTPPPSRDARSDLPSRQYQIATNSPRNSVVDLKRNSYYGSSSGPATPPKRNSGYNTPTPPKRGSYSSVPLSENDAGHRSSRSIGKQDSGWFTSDSLSKARTRSSHGSSPKKGNYAPLHQRHDSSDDLGYGHPNPLEANPPTPRHNYKSSQDSPLSEISNNRQSGDIADMSSERDVPAEPLRENFKAKYYGDLKPSTPPVMLGGKGNRQVSSGTDFVQSQQKGGFRKRDASGKIAEEGFGGGLLGIGSRVGCRWDEMRKFVVLAVYRGFG